MKIKPKEVLINMPVVLMFDDENKINEFAANVNTILHGKVKVKCEDLGVLGEQHVGLFYLQRNGEYHGLRETFVNMIEGEEVNQSDLFSHLEKAADATESRSKEKKRRRDSEKYEKIYCSRTPECGCGCRYDGGYGDWKP